MKRAQLKLAIATICSLFITSPLFSASVVASVGGTPITDADVTSRTKLMARQGDTSTDNRRRALQNIIDDHIKLEYAANFKAIPSDKDVDKELKAIDLGELSATDRAVAKSAMTATIAWQIVVARTIVPTITVSDEDIAQEKQTLAKTHGLPLEMTIVRLIDIPSDIAAKLTKPKNCEDAIQMAENMGGAPQKFTAAQYELSSDVRERVVGLPIITWSAHRDNSVFLVCSNKKTKDYGKLDDIIKQNTVYKKALFMADQQLKQLRRKSVIVINDPKYKI